MTTQRLYSKSSTWISTIVLQTRFYTLISHFDSLLHIMLLLSVTRECWVRLSLLSVTRVNEYWVIVIVKCYTYELMNVEWLLVLSVTRVDACWVIVLVKCYTCWCMLSDCYCSVLHVLMYVECYTCWSMLSDCHC